MSEKLYNGIELSGAWPPESADLSSPLPQRVPYLENPPETVCIDIGRQLLVDDFIVDAAATNMVRVFHQPVKYPCNPIFFAQSKEELDPQFAPCATPKCGGVWFDASDRLFKMWYMTGYLGYMAHAVSSDGVNWQRPEFDVVEGTNLCLPKQYRPDSGSVIIDFEAEDPDERYKMLMREFNRPDKGTAPAFMFTSPDGIHWTERGLTGPMQDRSTAFYNPFRKKWVQSIRWWDKTSRRVRYYREHEDFLGSGMWDGDPDLAWLRADCMDKGVDMYPELYNLDAIAYESLMIGFFQILKGPPNHISDAAGMPKLTELTLGFSRDGFHFDRPDRNSFIDARREPGSWEYGYVESSAGMCAIVGDELWFYYTSYAGEPERAGLDWKVAGTYANGAMGLAKLRRDGFASMCSRFRGAGVQTRPVLFKGSRLFVNANTVGSGLTVKVIGEDGEVIKGFDAEDCVAFLGNSTCVEIKWKDKGLGELAGKPVRLKFEQDRGDLYSFWVTDSPEGKSGGYLAAGGPAYSGYIDA